MCLGVDALTYSVLGINLRKLKMDSKEVPIYNGESFSCI